MNVDLLTKQDLEPIIELLQSILKEVEAIKELRSSVNVKYTPEEAAKELGLSRATIIRATNKNSKDRYYLKAHRNSPNGPLTIYAEDLEDYKNRRGNNYKRKLKY